MARPDGCPQRLAGDALPARDARGRPDHRDGAGADRPGYAYVVDGDVYFRVRSFPATASCPTANLDDLLAGARIEVDERKDDPLDFALWKAAKPGEPSWESPWGPRAARLAHRVLGDELDLPRWAGRHPRRRRRPHLPAPRERDRPERSVPRRRAVRPLLGAQRSGARRGREDVQVAGQLRPLSEIVERGLGPAFPLDGPAKPLPGAADLHRGGLAGRRAAWTACERQPTQPPWPRQRRKTDPTPRPISRRWPRTCGRRFHPAMDDDFNAPEALAALFDLAQGHQPRTGEGQAAADRAGAADARRAGSGARARAGAAGSAAARPMPRRSSICCCGCARSCGSARSGRSPT